MENNEQASILGKIRYNMSLDLSIPSHTIDHSLILAPKDKYLYGLLSDWMNESNSSIKKELLIEIINYTDEVIRIKGLQ